MNLSQKFVFFVTGLLLLVATSGSTDVSAQVKDAVDLKKSSRDFVQGFYSWYLPTISKGSSTATPELAITKKKALFSADLYKQLKDDFDASAKASGEIVGLDFDPYLNAQDISDRYVAGKVTEKNGHYLVDVHGMSAGKKNPKPDVVPEVVFKNGKWTFVNFHYGKSSIPENENLLSILKVLREDRAKTH